MTNDEINSLVAKKLGVTKCECNSMVHHGSDPVTHLIPNYSGYIQAAWEIVEYLVEKKMTVTVYCAFDGFCCAIEPSNEKFLLKADTAPSAICLAFLKLEDK